MHSIHTLPEGAPDGPIMHDGCSECEERGADPYKAITSMDTQRFAYAYQRAATLQLHGLPNLQQCERRTLDVLIAVNLQMERRGFKMGELPDVNVAVKAVEDVVQGRFAELHAQVQFLVDYLGEHDLLDDDGTFTFPDGETWHASTYESTS